MHNNDQIFTGYKPDKPVSEEIRIVMYELCCIILKMYINIYYLYI